MSFNPASIRPRRDWVLVLDDLRKSVLESGIVIAVETGLEKVREGTGTLVRVGIGDKTKALGIEPGQRVVYRSYLKYANPVETDEKWPDGTAKRYFLMSCEDLFAVIPPGMEVGVFSGRPQVPAKEG